MVGCRSRWKHATLSIETDAIRVTRNEVVDCVPSPGSKADDRAFIESIIDREGSRAMPGSEAEALAHP
jgi:hypothetical protein